MLRVEYAFYIVKSNMTFLIRFSWILSTKVLNIIQRSAAEWESSYEQQAIFQWVMVVFSCRLYDMRCVGLMQIFLIQLKFASIGMGIQFRHYMQDERNNWFLKNSCALLQRIEIALHFWDRIQIVERCLPILPRKMVKRENTGHSYQKP